MSPPSTYQQARNAAIALCDQLPDNYRAPILRHVANLSLASLRGRCRTEAALADLLDELTEALTTQARAA